MMNRAALYFEDPAEAMPSVNAIPSENIDTPITAKDLLQMDIKTLPYLIKPLFPQTGIVALVGASDTGKSSALRQLAVAIVTGEPHFLGFPIESKNKRVLYVSTEDDELAMAHLLKKAERKQKDYSGLHFLFDTDNLIEQVESYCKSFQYDAVIVDAFSDVYTRSANESNQVRTFLNQFSQLAMAYKMLVIFLHHTGKRTGDLAPSKHNILGSQGFEAKMRCVIELRSDVNEPQLKHLCIVKGNYLHHSYKDQSYLLRFNDDLTFTNTGDRVPFDMLAATRKGNTQITDEKHRMFIDEVFKDNERLQFSKLKDLLKDAAAKYQFTIGDNVAKDAITYYQNMGWIITTGTKGTRNCYYLKSDGINKEELAPW